MAEKAARLIDHVFAPLPVRQWVLAVPKRLRIFLRRGTALQGAALRIFLSVVQCCLCEHNPVAPPLVRRGPIDRDDAPEMRACVYDGGFSVVNGFANPTESGDAKKAGMVFAASEPGQGRAQPGEANP